jgi:hypothetical protein
MAVRSALRSGLPLPPRGRFLELISVRELVNDSIIVQMEGLSQMKNPMASSGIKPAILHNLLQE